MLQYDNLHYSYTPDTASNLSRKKLALMLGIKAAKYDIILTTNAHCTSQSDKWISSMACHFATGADVVIGYSNLTKDNDTSFGCRLRAFLYLRHATKFLVYAIHHKPFRGNSNNLAYRKSLFFKNKGFHRSMHLHFGDDDLFINEITTKHNTCVEISPESIISLQYNNPARIFNILKLRHCFTERMIRSWAFTQASLSTITFYCCILSAFSLIVSGFYNLITLSVGVFLLLFAIIPQMILYRKIAKLLQSQELMFTVPFFTLLHPFVNLYYNLNSRRHTDYNYTWQKLKN